MSYYLRKIKKIKNVLEKNTYPSIFNARRWKMIRVNCYSYSLDIPVSDMKKRIWIPGCICNEKAEAEIWKPTDLIERVKQDLEFLEISYRENTMVLKKGEWRIAIYVQRTPHDWPIGFHISRQDNDGIWSEKPSWTGKVEKIGDESVSPPNLEKHKLHLEDILILSKKVNN